QPHFIRLGADEARKQAPSHFVLLYPQIPRRSLFVPTAQILEKSCLHSFRQRSLGTTVEVDLLFEDRELGPDCGDCRINQNRFPLRSMGARIITRSRRVRGFTLKTTPHRSPDRKWAESYPRR